MQVSEVPLNQPTLIPNDSGACTHESFFIKPSQAKPSQRSSSTKQKTGAHQHTGNCMQLADNPIWLIRFAPDPHTRPSIACTNYSKLMSETPTKICIADLQQQQHLTLWANMHSITPGSSADQAASLRPHTSSVLSSPTSCHSHPYTMQPLGLSLESSSSLNPHESIHNDPLTPHYPLPTLPISLTLSHTHPHTHPHMKASAWSRALLAPGGGGLASLASLVGSGSVSLAVVPVSSTSLITAREP